MSIPYRTQRVLKRISVIVLAAVVILGAVWACWMLWVQRYIVYTPDEGAKLDFSLPPMQSGEVAVEPEELEISIYLNQGENAINTSTELTQLSGYYVEQSALKDLATVKSQIQSLEAGTAVMIDMKNIYGDFYYSSNVGTYRSSQVNAEEMDAIVSYLKRSGLYTIARIPAFRDYNYGLNNVPFGISHSSGAYLYMDDDGCYWLDPGSEGALSYLSQIITELKELGFDEVVLYDFCFPQTEKIQVSGDQTELLTNAANVLMSACATNSFALSFEKTQEFTMPEGRTRMYLSGLEASEAAAAAENSGVPDKTINLVFLTELYDTRFNEYSVMRPLSGAH